MITFDFISSDSHCQQIPLNTLNSTFFSMSIVESSICEENLTIVIIITIIINNH